MESRREFFSRFFAPETYEQKETDDPVLNAKENVNQRSPGMNRREFIRLLTAMAGAVMAEKIVPGIVEAKSKNEAEQELPAEFSEKLSSFKEFLFEQRHYVEGVKEMPEFFERIEDLRNYVRNHIEEGEVVEAYADFLSTRHSGSGVSISIYNGGSFPEKKSRTDNASARGFMLDLLTREELTEIRPEELVRCEKSIAEFFG